MNRIWKRGDFFIWLTGTALGLSLLMVAGLLLVVVCQGLGYFWPDPVVALKLKDGKTVLGQIVERQVAVAEVGAPTAVKKQRYKIKRANRDLYDLDFVWIEADEIDSIRPAPETVILERLEWGDFYGTIKEVRQEGRVATGEAGWPALLDLQPRARDIYSQVKSVEKGKIGGINYRIEKTRLLLKKLELEGKSASPETIAINREIEQLSAGYGEAEKELDGLRAQLAATGSVLMQSAEGVEKEIPLHQVVRAYRSGQWGWAERLGFFFAKAWEFVWEDPRESNTEGGIFPAIFGTVMMVLLMSVFATPLGVLAALYLREYAGHGVLVSVVRIAVNNLAGVPSIVFGVFGMGFFIYFIGGSIDRVFYPEVLPTPTYGTGGILWASLTLALLTVPVVIVATEEGLAAVPRSIREASLALGATQFETIRLVVLPAVMPSILTGLILAMARAAGEVAPLMITGVVKLAPSLPVDGFFPFIHPERKFMHLGFHIYDVGFQSPNVDAAQPMVYATTLFLILIVLLLNFAAIALRNRLRRKLMVSAV
jgi:phosphate transport system permease protein